MGRYSSHDKISRNKVVFSGMDCTCISIFVVGMPLVNAVFSDDVDCQFPNVLVRIHFPNINVCDKFEVLKITPDAI